MKFTILTEHHSLVVVKRTSYALRNLWHIWDGGNQWYHQSILWNSFQQDTKTLLFPEHALSLRLRQTSNSFTYKVCFSRCFGKRTGLVYCTDLQVERKDSEPEGPSHMLCRYVRAETSLSVDLTPHPAMHIEESVERIKEQPNQCIKDPGRYSSTSVTNTLTISS